FLATSSSSLVKALVALDLEGQAEAAALAANPIFINSQRADDQTRDPSRPALFFGVPGQG
ncbi:hypothetical protein, partial [uncultured Actinomyces sp.]|uniref:hypothetical protein n=1 Tax=uncultured Actinomyces sp. TaxID=249061 RepID=UPI00262A966B